MQDPNKIIPFRVFFHWQVAGFYTVAVGIGSGINRQTLNEIAGENGRVMAVESFDQLANELGEIKDKVCSE